MELGTVLQGRRAGSPIASSISPITFASSATRWLCRTTAGPSACGSLCAAQNGFAHSSCRTRDATKTVWGRYGKRDGHFGPTGPGAKRRFVKTSSLRLRLVSATWARVRTSIDTIPTSGRTNLRSSKARPTRHPDRPVLRLPHQCRELSGVATVAARYATSTARRVGEVRPVVRSCRSRGLSARRARS
jgi:hypothetical protein